MQMAIAAPADERHAWVQVALLWQFLGNTNDADSHEIRKALAQKTGACFTDADREEDAVWYVSDADKSLLHRSPPSRETQSRHNARKASRRLLGVF
jgi:hypothetical protein